jgi:hypothetical protein
VPCSTKNPTRRCVQLAVSNSWLSSLLASLERVMGHRSLLIATAPQRFPRRVGSDLAHPAACGCAFATADSVQRRDAATPGRCRRRARSGLALNQETIRFHSPSKGSFWVRRQPRTRFLFSCSWYKVGSPPEGSRTLPLDRNQFRSALFHRKDSNRQ